MKRDTRRWLAVAFAASIAWAAYLMAFGHRVGVGEMDPPDLEGRGLAMPADYDWKLLDLDGAPTDLARFRGKTVVLNLWATWCGPCLQEIPSLVKLAADERLKKGGVEVVCVSTDESAGAFRRFMEGKDWPMTTLRATSIPPVFTTEGIPATFVIAPDGRVAASHLGAAQWDDPSVAKFLEDLARPAR